MSKVRILGIDVFGKVEHLLQFFFGVAVRMHVPPINNIEFIPASERREVLTRLRAALTILAIRWT